MHRELQRLNKARNRLEAKSGRATRAVGKQVTALKNAADALKAEKRPDESENKQCHYNKKSKNRCAKTVADGKTLCQEHLLASRQRKRAERGRADTNEKTSKQKTEGHKWKRLSEIIHTESKAAFAEANGLRPDY